MGLQLQAEQRLFSVHFLGIGITGKTLTPGILGEQVSQTKVHGAGAFTGGFEQDDNTYGGPRRLFYNQESRTLMVAVGDPRRH